MIIILTNESRVAVAEWLARPPAKQEVCSSNPVYLYWNTHVGKVTAYYAGYIHQQRCRTIGESQGMFIMYASTKSE